MYITWDTETENLNLLDCQNRIWQIAWIEFDQYKKEHNRQERLLYWEDLKLGQFSKDNTSFSKEKYETDSLPPGEVLDEFLGVLLKEGNVDVTANGFGFDFYMLKNLTLQLGRGDFKWDWFSNSHDICNLYKAMLLKEDVNKEEYFLWNIRMSDFWRRGMKYGVETICKDLNIEYDTKAAHDAMYDTQKTMECFNKLRWKMLES